MITLTKVGNNVKYVGVDGEDNCAIGLEQDHEATIDGSNVYIKHGRIKVSTVLSNLSLGGTTPTDEATFWTALATVFPSAAPATALPTEYPATYAAMQTSITADSTTKRDFFVTGENAWYRYDGTSALPVGAGNLLTPNAVIAFFGTSITGNGFNSAASSVNYNTLGYSSWVLQRINFKLYTPVGANAGISGNTTTQMLARLGAVLALSPKIVVVEGGTNDIAASATSATIISNLSNIYNASLAIGARVVAITILPRYSPNAFNGAQETVRQAVNTWIKSQASSKIIVVDAETTMSNSSYYSDGIHPNDLGAYQLGALVGGLINPILPDVKITDNIGVDTNIITNGNLFNGTGGTKSGASGVVADSFQLQGTSGGGATVTGSKTTSSEGLQQQKIDITGNYTGSSVRASLFQNASVTLGVGDTLEGYLDFEVITSTGMWQIFNAHSIRNSVPATVMTGNGLSLSSNTFASPLPAGRYQMRTPPIVIPNGVPVQIDNYIHIYFTNAGVSTPINISIKIHKFGIRKISLGGRRQIIDTAATLANTDKYIAFTSLTATRAVTLPAASAVTANQTFIIKDEAGTAGTNNITIVGTVNGSVNPTAINSNYGTYKLYSNGTAWFTE